MISTELYDGQGIGNQLWAYAVTRTIAQDRNMDFSILGRDNWKGAEFMKIDFGNNYPVITNHYQEKMIRNQIGIDITPYDNNLVSVPSETKIDGNMQSVKYIEHNKANILKWLKISQEEDYGFSKKNSCLIHFRGGDYLGAGNTLLSMKYYMDAIFNMKKMNKNMKFFVVTDDCYTASTYFSGIADIIGSSISGIPDNKKASHHSGGNISVDYNIINHAKNVILSNSTFGWWATWTNKVVKNVIAPKYWFAHNYSNGYWSTADMRVAEWNYLDREGEFS